MPCSRRPRPRRRPIPSCASSSSAARAPARPSTRCSPTTSTRPRRSRSRSRCIILLFAFGALVAAGLPLLLGLTAVLGTMGVVAGVSQFAPATDNLMSVVLLVGLAVGVDYSLFYIRREREERKAGRDPEAALEAAAATSGRTVLVSGFTVMAAMAGMYLTGDKGFSSMATGTILVVGVAMIGSLTVLPAMLSKLGDNVDRGRIPFLGKRSAARSESRVWSWTLDRVLKRPLAAAADLRRPPRRAVDPGLRPAHRELRHERHPAEHARDEDVQPHHRGVPGREEHRRGRREGRRRHEAAPSPARSARWSRRPRPPAPRSTTSPPTSARTTRSQRRHPDRRQRQRREVRGRPGVAARRHRPGHGRQRRTAPRRSSAVTPPRTRTTTTC